VNVLYLVKIADTRGVAWLTFTL